MICYTQIKVLNVNNILTFSSLAFNAEKLMQDFLQRLSNGTIEIFPAYSVSIQF